ncbi:MAG: acyltransferase [Opitutales bacterium]|nr:acyltransferase [Opitutales bacterium]
MIRFFYNFFHGNAYALWQVLKAWREMWRLRGRVVFNGYPLLTLRGTIKWGGGIVVNSDPSSNLYGLRQRSIIVVCPGATIEIGDRVGMSAATLHAKTSIKIGAGTLIGGNAKILDHDFHPLDWRERNPDKGTEKTAPIVIGEKCFIGGDSIILRGAKLGDHCVVGAGSVVPAGDYPAGSVLVGNPAKIVKTLD